MELLRLYVCQLIPHQRTPPKKKQPYGVFDFCFAHQSCMNGLIFVVSTLLLVYVLCMGPYVVVNSIISFLVRFWINKIQPTPYNSTNMVFQWWVKTIPSTVGHDIQLESADSTNWQWTKKVRVLSESTWSVMCSFHIRLNNLVMSLFLIWLVVFLMFGFVLRFICRTISLGWCFYVCICF